MLKARWTAAVYFLISTFTAAAWADSETWNYKYCVPVNAVNLNPFREINDGKDLAYLLLLKSYISTDSNDPGILESFEFSPDGKLLTARLSKGLKWPDGTNVTAQEAAQGIVGALPFRPLGKRLKLKKPINIINDQTFQLSFETEIENLTGALREALSTNSRHNRFWLYKLNSKNQEMALSKNSFINKSKTVGFQVNSKDIQLVSKNQCNNPDFSIFPETLSSVDDFKIRRGPLPSAISFQPNTSRLNQKERRQLSEWIRFAFSDQPLQSGISNVTGFFLPGESGHSDKDLWADNSKLKISRKIKIAYEIPVFKTVLEAAAKKSAVNIELIPLPFTGDDVDGQILASGIQEGRHVILQDVLQWPHVADFLKNAPITKKSLQNIAQLSASTIPPDNTTLRAFEKSASKEVSLVPVARKYPLAYSRKTASVCLNWSPKGELQFNEGTACDQP